MFTHFYAVPALGICDLLKSPAFPGNELNTKSGSVYELKKMGSSYCKFWFKKNNLYMREALNQNIMTIFKPKLI